MKWLVAGCALVALGGSPVLAGPCSQQIDALQRILSSHDAGSGPVQGGQEKDASRQVSEAGSSTRATTEAARSPAEVRTTAAGNGSDRTGPTGAIGQAAGGSATSPQDVRLQQQGQPTQAEAARNGTPSAARGEDRLQKVTAHLDRARSLDQRNDSACMGALDAAKQNMAAE